MEPDLDRSAPLLSRVGPGLPTRPCNGTVWPLGGMGLELREIRRRRGRIQPFLQPSQEFAPGRLGVLLDPRGTMGGVLHDTRGLHLFTFWRLRVRTPQNRQNVN
jgi:hypothetical protein